VRRASSAQGHLRAVCDHTDHSRSTSACGQIHTIPPPRRGQQPVRRNHARRPLTLAWLSKST
jgi:hypothetical protein